MTKTGLITLIISVVGGMIGSAGLTLSILNYLRDRPVVKVSLQWDMSIKPTPFESLYDHNKPWGLIRVTNIGRRPTYIAVAAIQYLPTVYERGMYRLLKRRPRNAFCALISDSIRGKKLSEGDPAEVFVISQDGREQHRKYWLSVRALVEDSAGKKYYSPPVDRCPSWAGGLPWAGAEKGRLDKPS